MNTYLITGGAGFIGSNLVDELIKENKIIVIDNFDDYYSSELKEKNIQESITHAHYHLEKVDIRNQEEVQRVFQENTIDFVIHLAGIGGVRYSIVNPEKYQEINYIGTLHILEAMRKYRVKNILFASSSSVYGDCEEVPFKETFSCNMPISPYAASKKSAEMLLYVYHHLYGFNVIVNRFFTVYGKRLRPDLAISKFTKCILEEEPIPFYGDGKTYRDYTYIKDIIQGIKRGLAYMQKNENVYEIINLGCGSPITLIQMVETLEKVLHKKAMIHRMDKQEGDVHATYADIAKAKKLLGYHPQYTFEKGIQEFVEWYLETNHITELIDNKATHMPDKKIKINLEKLGENHKIIYKES